MDWEGSIGSDSCIGHFTNTEQDARPPKEARNKQFEQDIDGKTHEAWTKELGHLWLTPKSTPVRRLTSVGSRPQLE